MRWPTIERLRIEWLALAAGLVFAAACLSYSAWYQAPVNDEFGHFYAGLRYWQFGDTSTFKVNSPLLRSLATLPAYLAGMSCGEVEMVSNSLGYNRPEFLAGRRLFIADPPRFQFWLSVGRMLVVTVTLCGGVLLYGWGKSLGGRLAGVLAAGLWFAQPQVLAHGGLITGDVFCAVLMLLTLRGMAWTLPQLGAIRSIALGGLLDFRSWRSSRLWCCCRCSYSASHGRRTSTPSGAYWAVAAWSC